jgi:type IV secretory pathway TraG/TraD family ATPase VirD4
LNSTPETKPGSDRGLIALIACFIGLIAIKKFDEIKPILEQWAHAHIETLSTVGAALGLLLAAFGYGAFQVFKDRYQMNRYLHAITSEQPGSVFAGYDATKRPIFIPLEARRMHTEVIGTTNAGKSESVVIPWAVADIRDKRGFIIVDGKADQTFITKIYSYVKRFKRKEDFKVFSLQDPSRSHTFNPLLGGTPEEVAERVFNSFEYDNAYYKSVQYEVFSQVLRIFDSAKMKPTFLRVYQAIKNPQALYDLAAQGNDSSLESWASGFKALSPSDRDERTSGLLSSLSHFAFGAYAKLFNTDRPDIDLDSAIRESELIYFQLPVLKAAFLGKATGKLVLQCLQSAVANRHQEGDKEHPFFSAYLDDFTEYLYPGFVTLLNKSRSANVGVVFAHQAIGDIKSLGDDVANSILTNSNLKVIMRGNDPDTAEYFSKVIGTQEGEQTTERAERKFFGQSRTGQGSVREVEEFIVHPNLIKRNMGVGEALVILPHKYGSQVIKLKFQMVPSLPKEEMPKPAEKAVLGLPLKTEPNPGTTAEATSSMTKIINQHQTTQEAA